MAENEYLDSSKACRWRSVVQAIQDGCSIDEVAQRVEECFFKTLRQIRKDLPFAEMIRAMDDPEELSRVCGGWPPRLKKTARKASPRYTNFDKQVSQTG